MEIRKAIVVYGNPADGFSFVGVFEDANEAGDWAEQHLSYIDWWVIFVDDKEVFNG